MATPKLPVLTASRNHLLVGTESSLIIHDANKLTPVGTVPASGVSAFFLHDLFLFIARGPELFYILLSALPMSAPEPRPIVIPSTSRGRITALTAVGSFLYAGTETGRVHVFTFNADIFRPMADASISRHGLPITRVTSDARLTLVSDCRSRITEYPGGVTYDFDTAPLLWSGAGRLYCTDGSKIFVRAPEGMCMLMDLADGDSPGDMTIEYLNASREGGILFAAVASGCIVCVDVPSRKILEKIQGVRRVVHVEQGLVQWKEGKAVVVQGFALPDKRPDGVQFRRINIVEKHVSPAEFEEKRLGYISEGPHPGENVPNTKRAKWRIVDVSEENESSFEGVELSDDGDVSVAQETRSPSLFHFPEATAPPSGQIVTTVAFSPGTHRTSASTLLYWSHNGYMISVPGTTSASVSIHRFGRPDEVQETRDARRSHLGSFDSSAYVLSDGKVVDFNGEWSKEYADVRGVALVGEYVMVLSGVASLLLLTRSGECAAEILVPGYYTFCYDDRSLAVATAQFILIIEDVLRVVSSANRSPPVYVPFCGTVDFACFHNGSLYVRFSGLLAVHRGGLLQALGTVGGVLLGMVRGRVAVLKNTVSLLPDPQIEYVVVPGGSDL